MKLKMEEVVVYLSYGFFLFCYLMVNFRVKLFFMREDSHAVVNVVTIIGK